MQNNNVSEPVIVKTDTDAKDGQNKCPKCGATEIKLNINTGKLRCEFCRYEFEPKKVTGMVEDISKLHGQVLSSGAQDISESAKDIVTLKCSSCGAEVVIDTSSVTQARCHWCRNTLSINQQIPNGSIPDIVLPFKVNKEQAKFVIENFVKKRKFFVNKKFKDEFTTENILGVYFPYMVVDANCHSSYTGQGEKLIRKYVDKNNSAKFRYDADLYDVAREFDITINGLTIESSSERLDNSSSDKTNNIINSIMPFDVENCVKFDSNYLKGYTSEKRDVNIAEIRNMTLEQLKDISRHSCNSTLKEYDRGVCWNKEKVDVIGEQWKTAYLPVWLYSYQEIKGSKKILHYVAVNARTKEVMGSVPINMPKLIIVSGIVEFFGFLFMLIVDSEYSWLFLLAGVIFFVVMYMKYRNFNARHHYEKETKSNITNLKQYDKFIRRKNGLTNSLISGVNNNVTNGSNNILGNLYENTSISKILDDINSNKKGGKE